MIFNIIFTFDVVGYCNIFSRLKAFQANWRLAKKNIKDAPGAQLRNMFAIITMKITQKSGIRKH